MPAQFAPTPAPSASATLLPDAPSMGINLGLPRILRLLHSLSSPHLAAPLIHIGGTNGKGSVSSYLSSILRESGVPFGRFNSPHLVEMRDCLEINGSVVALERWEGAWERVRAKEKEKEGEEQCSSFEKLTAVAFEAFREAKERGEIEVVIVEVGMGGETDATNVVPSERTLVSVLTSVELDHQRFLGDTVAEIARVKTGIVKRGGEAVLAEQAHEETEMVLREMVSERGARGYAAGRGVILREQDFERDVPPLVQFQLAPLRTFPPEEREDASTTTTQTIEAHLPLPGSYQLSNAAAALLTAQVLRTSKRCLALVPSLSKITDVALISGIERTRWPGRLDWIHLPSSPLSTSPPPPSHRILLDGAHNPSSCALLSSYLASLPPDHAPTTLIIALTSPRDPLSILTPLLSPSPTGPAKSRITRVICTTFSKPEGMEWIAPTATNVLAAAASAWKESGVHVEECEDPEEALGRLREGERAVVAGSLYLVADVLRVRRKRE